MIRFLLDMGIARSTAEYLRQQGHDVVHLHDQGLERLPDDQIVEKATEERRSIVTHDLDFGRIKARGMLLPERGRDDRRSAFVNAVQCQVL